VEAEKVSKAMVAYEKALEWQELFDLALREHMSEVDIISMGYRIAGWFLQHMSLVQLNSLR
jgi:elongator complex protein 1